MSASKSITVDFRYDDYDPRFFRLPPAEKRQELLAALEELRSFPNANHELLNRWIAHVKHEYRDDDVLDNIYERISMAKMALKDYDERVAQSRVGVCWCTACAVSRLALLAACGVVFAMLYVCFC